MVNFRKNSKGITLIALVITIIIILIVAGVSILTLSGENGLINKTIHAKNSQNIGEIKDKVNIAQMSLKIDGKEINANNVKDELIKEKSFNNDEIVVDNSKPNKIIIRGEEFELYINRNEAQNPEEPDTTQTFTENVGIAKSALGSNANTKTIIKYFKDNEIYTEEQIISEIQIIEKDDFQDTLKKGSEQVDVSTNRYTVYFEKPDSWNANSVYVHIWYKNTSGTDISYASWPGTQIHEKSEGSKIFKCQLPECAEGYEWEKIIFNNGSGNPQTDDLEMGNKGQIFTNAMNNEIIYSNAVGHFVNLKLYAWKNVNGTVVKNAEWPGIDMNYFEDSKGKKIYWYDMQVAEGESDWEYFIINDSDNKVQTFNIPYQGGNRIYCVNGGNDFANDPSDNNKSKLKESSKEALYGNWINRE